MSADRHELGAKEQAVMVRALRHALSATLIETHISYVLVVGDLAYKLKKALATAFLDQTTCALRQLACEEELRLNRRLAPGLYLSVVAITGTPAAPVLGGNGPAIDHAVQMRAFSQDALWEARAAAGLLRAEDIDELARQLAAFHAGAAVAAPHGPWGEPAQVRAQVLQNLAELQDLLPALPPAAADTLRLLRGWESTACAAVQPLLARRLAHGRVRECHGDLHLGNVTEVDGRTTVFDGIEFSAALRWINVMSDIAFMAMDLQAHGLEPLAHRFVNAWLEASGDYDGVGVLDYYVVHRALVRAKVSLLRARQFGDTALPQAAAALAAADRYLALALRASRPAPPMLLFTHGCSGSGKSSGTQDLLEAMGAVRVRSNVERRRVHGPVGGSRYDATMTAATYAELKRLARTVLQAGHTVIVDATFLKRTDRDTMRRLAGGLQLRCEILDFASGADLALMRRRVRERAARGHDASEADEAVLDAQLAAIEPLQADELAIARPGWPQPLAPGHPMTNR